jgi:23S rRNA pseudoU1915 N3-methylase RlmH
MESINNTNNINIELAEKKSKQLQQKIKKVLKKTFKLIHNKIVGKKIVILDETCSEIDENNFNEMLERRMEDQQNLINEQIIGQQASGYYFVETAHGKFYWSSEVSKFIAFEEKFDSSSQQSQSQIQCC